jgi:hypothetical protein
MMYYSHMQGGKCLNALVECTVEPLIMDTARGISVLSVIGGVRY